MSLLQLSAWKESCLLFHFFSDSLKAEIICQLQDALGKHSIVSILNKLVMLRDLLAGHCQFVICAIA